MSDAWHVMWVMGMSHEVCAAVRMQCLIAVVGHKGLYTGFRDCTAICEAVAVSFAGLMCGLKCVHVWYTYLGHRDVACSVC